MAAHSIHTFNNVLQERVQVLRGHFRNNVIKVYYALMYKHFTTVYNKGIHY